jgi:hypothetical protein
MVRSNPVIHPAGWRVAPHAPRPGRPACEHSSAGWTLRAARSCLSTGGSVLFVGSVGVDRTAMLDALVEDAPTGEAVLHDAVVPDSGGRRVLRCSPAPAEAELAFCGLARLLSALTDDELDALTSAHRRALTAVLLGGTEPAAGGTLAALRLAALRWFQTLAGCGPLLLVVDDVQWLDDPSADVLWFVSRRFDRLRIQMAASELVPYGAYPLGRQLCPPQALEIRLDPVGPTNAPHAVRRRRRWASSR